MNDVEHCLDSIGGGGQTAGATSNPTIHDSLEGAMPLIRVGNIEQFSTQLDPVDKSKLPSTDKLNTSDETEVPAQSAQPPHPGFALSDSPRGLGLKKLTLKEGFEGLFQKLINKDNEIYFVSWAWDLSGQPAYEHPGGNASADSVIIPMTVGTIREFIGDGILLFPSRTVTAGLALRMMIWESDERSRAFGKTLIEVSDAIKKSELNNLLSTISVITASPVATVSMITNASLELAKIIGTIMEKNNNDYVDLFEGYYPVSYEWSSHKEETYSGNSSEIVLRMM